MKLQKINLMEAYLIETLRSKGITNQEILAKIEQGSVEGWKDLHEHFDFHELLKLNYDDLKPILTEGYKIKYITFNGMQNLIKLKFGKVKDNDYQLSEKGINNLNLSEEQANTLAQMISPNWVFNWDGGTGSLTHK